MNKNKNNKFEFRELASEDSGSLHDLLMKVFDYLSDLYYPKQLIEDWRKQFTQKRLNEILISNLSFAYGCFEGNKLIGFIWGFYEYRTFFVDWLGVDPGCFRKGIMSRLLKLVEIDAKKERIYKIYFNTYIKNIPAISVYLKNGYKIEGVHRNHWDGGDYIAFGKIIRKAKFSGKINSQQDFRLSGKNPENAKKL